MNLNVENILVVGLGMIGSSIAFAAKSKGINVNGFDLNDDVLKKAIDENIIDATLESIEEINTNQIDLIILAVPPKQTLELFNKLDYLWNTKITITDTSSVKNHIKLKDVNNIVLSHPIAGSDKSGIDALDKNLFIIPRDSGFENKVKLNEKIETIITAISLKFNDLKNLKIIYRKIG